MWRRVTATSPLKKLDGDQLEYNEDPKEGNVAVHDAMIAEAVEGRYEKSAVLGGLLDGLGGALRLAHDDD